MWILSTLFDIYACICYIYTYLFMYIIYMDHMHTCVNYTHACNVHYTHTCIEIHMYSVHKYVVCTHAFVHFTYTYICIFHIHTCILNECLHTCMYVYYTYLYYVSLFIYNVFICVYIGTCLWSHSCFPNNWLSQTDVFSRIVYNWSHRVFHV